MALLAALLNANIGTEHAFEAASNHILVNQRLRMKRAAALNEWCNGEKPVVPPIRRRC